MKVSKVRADAVVKELITKHGIGPERLKEFGLGSLARAGTNQTHEGRTKKRRVEPVEQ